jgi:hypothetical protein
MRIGPPNEAGAVDAPIARLFAFVSQGRRATDQQRWAKPPLPLVFKKKDSAHMKIW